MWKNIWFQSALNRSTRHPTCHRYHYTPPHHSTSHRITSLNLWRLTRTWVNTVAGRHTTDWQALCIWFQFQMVPSVGGGEKISRAHTQHMVAPVYLSPFSVTLEKCDARGKGKAQQLACPENMSMVSVLPLSWLYSWQYVWTKWCVQWHLFLSFHGWCHGRVGCLLGRHCHQPKNKK